MAAAVLDTEQIDMIGREDISVTQQAFQINISLEEMNPKHRRRIDQERITVEDSDDFPRWNLARRVHEVYMSVAAEGITKDEVRTVLKKAYPTIS